MKNVIIILFIFISAHELLAIKEIVTEYNLKIRGFIISDQGTQLLVKDLNLEEKLISKAQISEIYEIKSSVLTSDGSKIKGFITDINEDALTIVEDDIETTINTEEVLAIEHFSRGSSHFDTYFFAGAALFNPADVNLIFGGYFYPQFGLSALAGSDIGRELSVRGNFLFNFYNDKYAEHSIALGYGNYDIMGKGDEIFGIFYNLIVQGVFAELGWYFTYIETDAYLKNFTFQIGYIYWFR